MRSENTLKLLELIFKRFSFGNRFSSGTRKQNCIKLIHSWSLLKFISTFFHGNWIKIPMQIQLAKQSQWKYTEQNHANVHSIKCICFAYFEIVRKIPCEILRLQTKRNNCWALRSNWSSELSYTASIYSKN